MTSHARRCHALGMLALAALLAGCSSAMEAPTMLPLVELEAPEMLEEPAPEYFSEEQEAPMAVEVDNGSGQEFLDTASSAAERLIIKNANVTLLVADTRTAVDRLTQVVGDLGGYIISSREWTQEAEGENYQFATYTFAVPVRQFEQALGRLRDMAVEVLSESASGEDVSQEYVDLASRLTNLEATRDRIREFLAQAQTVEEALLVNEQLSEVEGQIEEIKGRMNYLEGRASFSTITVTLQPEIITHTPTPTPTPTATPTPTSWSPQHTFDNAKKTLGGAYRSLTDLLIWLLVVAVPIFGPFVLVGWVIYRATRKRPKPNIEKEKAKEAEPKKK